MPVATPGGKFRWEGEVEDYKDAFDVLRPSLILEVNGTSFSVPSREDYTEAFLNKGHLVPEEDLTAHSELVAAAQAHWHRDGNNSCVFAAQMSAERDPNGWESYVMGNQGSPQKDADAIHALWSQRLVDPYAEIVSVIIPHGDEPEYVAALLRRLSTLPSWQITDQGQESDEAFGLLQKLGLLVTVEFDYLSEVLGFGPHGAFAHTRRAPFTELAIRAKHPRKRRTGRRAFMAQVDIPGLAPDEFGAWWGQTKANRASRVGSKHDDRAKARVTFAIPASAWEEDQ
jgi:hypothetical protein